MNSVYLNSIGIVAPGIDNWSTCREVLTKKTKHQPLPIPKFSPEALPVNERRRITPTIRLALQAATEAINNSSLAAESIATVFATSNGDLEISSRICNALTMPERPVSPTDFHNSVHNAPSGYWSIGSHCHLPSSSLSAGIASFSAGLLETITQVLNESHPVMLVAYDKPPPDIFANDKTVTEPFSVALVITPQKTDNSLAKLKVRITDQQEPSGLSIESLEGIRRGNPAGQALLLLDLAARQSTAHCLLPYDDDCNLLVDYFPC